MLQTQLCTVLVIVQRRPRRPRTTRLGARQSARGGRAQREPSRRPTTRRASALFVRTYARDVVVRLVGGEDAPAPAPARSRPRRAASAGARARAVTGLGPGETRVRRSAIVGHVSQIAARASNAGFTVDAYRARAEERRAAAAPLRDGPRTATRPNIVARPGPARRPAVGAQRRPAGACPFGLATFASVKDAHDAAGAPQGRCYHALGRRFEI